MKDYSRITYQNESYKYSLKSADCGIFARDTLYTRCTYLIRQIVADVNLLPRLYVASNGVTFVYYIRRTFGSIVGIKGIVHLLRVSPSNLVMRYA